MKPRIGVLFADGSIVIVSLTADPDGPEAEARTLLEGANKGQRKAKKKAKLVSIDLEPGDVVVIE